MMNYLNLIFLSFPPGWPSSSVTWWRAGAVLDTSWEEISPGKSRNTMKLERLSREDLNTRLECRGNNNNHTKPVTTNINININREFKQIPSFSHYNEREKDRERENVILKLDLFRVSLI